MRLVVASFLAPSLEALYRASSELIARRLGCSVDFVVGSVYEDLTTRRIDLGFICGLPYVQLADRSPPVHALAAPVVVGERYLRRPIYFSDVVVRKGSPSASFEQLRGADFRFNSLDSHSGYGVVLHHLASLGETTEFFGSFEGSGSHAESMRLVAEGRADAAAIDSHVLDVARLREPDLVAELEVIESLGPSPIQPLVAGDHVPGEVRIQVREVLSSAHEDRTTRPALARTLVDRFSAVEDGDYDDIRTMVRATEAAGMHVAPLPA